MRACPVLEKKRCGEWPRSADPAVSLRASPASPASPRLFPQRFRFHSYGVIAVAHHSPITDVPSCPRFTHQVREVLPETGKFVPSADPACVVDSGTSFPPRRYSASLSLTDGSRADKHKCTYILESMERPLLFPPSMPSESVPRIHVRKNAY